jgi:uncharacterized hydrophobic protein (TIGR00341 family)
MDLRLIEIRLPRDVGDSVRELLEDVEKLEVWFEPALDKQRMVRMLVDAADVEPALDKIERRFGHLPEFRAVILRVEATLPRPEEPEPEPKPPADDPPKKKERKAARISREELLSDLKPGTKVTGGYLALVILSAIVAAVGLLQNSVAIIIGAMVIAPLLTPNMALALATTLGDLELGRKAIRTGLAGILVAFVLSLGLGACLPSAPLSEEILSRTAFSPTDAVVALAAGAAGVLAFTAGLSAGLVGVMVAVALMPPLVAGGLLAGAGEFALAGHALLLLITNVICINLSGVVTFRIQGVRPRLWMEVEHARHASRRALILWVTALLALILLWALMEMMKGAS